MPPLKNVALPAGNTAIEFEHQIEERIRGLEQDSAWDVVHSKQGNPIAETPTVMVMYREDQRFVLDNVLPRLHRDHATGERRIHNSPKGYDLIIASQPFRSRASADSKAKNVLLPMMQNLKERGRLIVVQSTGHDPAMEIVQKAWPGEEPFRTPRHVLISKITEILEEGKAKDWDGSQMKAEHFRFEEGDQFKYELHALPEAGTASIGTSLLLAAWNAAVYVAQIDDLRAEEAIQKGIFGQQVQEVLTKHGQLWFQNEAFVIARRDGDLPHRQHSFVDRGSTNKKLKK